MPLTRLPSPLPGPPETGVTRLGFLKLSLDDIDDVMNHLRRRDMEPVLAAEHSTGTDAESLKSATPQELAKISVGTTDRTLAVHLWTKRAQITYRMEERAERAAAEIASILGRQRVPGIVTWFRSVVASTLVFVVLLVLVLGSVFLIRPNQIEPSIAQTFVVMSLLLVAGGIALGSVNYATSRQTGGVKLDPYFRRDRREARVSVGQAVWIAVISAVISGAVGSVVTWLVTSVAPSAGA